MDQLLLGAVDRIAPEGPGHGLQKGRLAVAVGAAQAADVHPLQVESGDVVPVALEVGEGELQGDHQRDCSTRPPLRAPAP